jgi:DNA-binding NarL/FixJ family response regulator
VTTSTVETHIRNAMRRLGARNRSHLVTLAIARREIDLGDLLKRERLERLKR